jgi:hypothetical protein
VRANRQAVHVRALGDILMIIDGAISSSRQIGSTPNTERVRR